MATKAQQMMNRAKSKDQPKSQPLPEPQPLPSSHESISTLSPASGLSDEVPLALEYDGSGDSDFAGGQSDEMGNGAASASGPRLLSKDEFFAAFKVMHSAPNLVPLPPFPLDALPIKDEEAQGARMASDTIYDIAAETEWLRWLIEPGSLWVQRTLVVASFAVPKAMAVAAEVRAKRARPVAPHDDKSPPSFGFADAAETQTPAA